MAATDALLANALSRDPAGPLLTFYDDRTAERAELSATTLAGWVAKTAGLLQDELGVEPGARVAVLLPAHWQTCAVLLGAWAAGGMVTTDPAGADVAFTDEGRLLLARAAAETVALSLLPLGRPFARAPDGVLDFAALVPGQPDAFMPHAPVDDDAPALDRLTGKELVADLRQRAGALGIRAGDRVLTALEWRDYPDWRDGFLAPLAAGAQVVLCAEPDPGALAGRAEAERVTAAIGARLGHIRSLDR